MTISSRTFILAGVSAVAMAFALPTIAAEPQAGTSEEKVNQRGPVVTEQDIKKGWEDTKDAVSNTAKDVSKAVEEKYDDVKAVVMDDDSKTPQTVFKSETFYGANSASTLIGRSVKDAEGNEVATIHDIIVDQDDDASTIILSDGGFFGIGGKLVAVEYGKIVTSSNNTETLNPISKNLVKDVAEFSYTPASGKVRLMPSDGISLRHALEGTLVDGQQKKLADIENVIIEDGEAEKLVVSFDKVLGLGGDYAAFDFDDVKVVRGTDNKVGFQLSAEQAANFENYKKSVTN
jgi:sporulation protein YlmC with PRC-barrel domain